MGSDLRSHSSPRREGVTALQGTEVGPMALIDGMLKELEQETQTTRRVLERVPDDRLSWRPHAKARTLGQLALHVATVPGGVAELATQSPAQAPDFADPSPNSASELVPTLEQSIAKAKKAL